MENSYRASITFSDDSGYDEEFSTLEGAVNFIEHWATGRDMCRAWINNSEVVLENCHVIMPELGERLKHRFFMCNELTEKQASDYAWIAISEIRRYLKARDVESRLREANMAEAVRQGMVS